MVIYDTSIQVGDSVKVIGGKHKHCVGILRELKPTFCKVELTQNVKKKITFPKPILRKVKKGFMEHWQDDILIEMPSASDLKVVDHFPDEEPNLMNTIEAALEKNKKEKHSNNNKEEDQEIVDQATAALKEGQSINENYVVEQAITMDGAEKWRAECLKLREEVAIYRLLRFADVPQIVSDIAQIRLDYARLYEECDHKDKEITRLAKFSTEIKKVVSHSEDD
jgi:hypothetical protein